MRALLLTEHGVVAVELDPDNQLDSMYGHMQCTTVCGAGYPDSKHACWADDEALLTLQATLDEKGYAPAFRVSWYPETLVGYLLVTGFDPDTGETTPATLSLEELASMVKPGKFKPHPKKLH